MVDTDTRKEQIYEAASALFSAHGYEATSVRDIARELGLQGGSLYAHISSKEDVLFEIVVRAADAFYVAVAPLTDCPAPTLELLRRMIHAHVGVVVNNLSHAVVFQQDWRRLGGPRKLEVLALRDGYEALFRRVLAAGVDRGELRECDPRLTSTLLLSALNGLPAWFQPTGRLDADTIADNFADLLLSGLVAPTVHPERIGT
jgi:AcrR family transcriptional regulator